MLVPNRYTDIVLLKLRNTRDISASGSYINKTIIGECLGLAQISSYCASKGISVEYIDAELEQLEDKELVKKIIDKKPKVLGIQLQFTNIGQVDALSGTIKKILNDIHIIVGGQYASINAEKMLMELQYVDSVCFGDGEMIAASLVESIEGDDEAGVAGVITRNSGTDTSKFKSTIPYDLDSLPHPDRKYLKISHKYGYESVGITTSRGCQYRCSFCVPSIYYRKTSKELWRSRSHESVIDEMEHHYSNGERIFTYSDVNFLPNDKAKERARKIAEGIMRSGMKDIKLMFDCRADSVDLELFKLLGEAGLFRVYIGFESFSQKALDRFRKGISSEVQIEALRICDKLGIEVIPGLILFEPRTTLDEVRDNLRCLERHKNIVEPSSYLSALSVLSGTPIYKELYEIGLIGSEEGGVCDWYFENGEVAKFFRKLVDIVEEYNIRWGELDFDSEKRNALMYDLSKSVNNEIDRIS
jgi:anaerobic magnesium-protoporphyrin IX monomethyl ester cyclase